MKPIRLSLDQANAIAALHRREIAKLARDRRMRVIHFAVAIALIVIGVIGAKLFARAAAPGSALSHALVHARSGR